MSETKSRKTKSPPTPSFSLRDSFNDAKKLYNNFSHASFSKTEIASALGLSSTSSSISNRVFTLTEYGLLERSGDSYKISETFNTLDSKTSEDPDFKKTALAAIKKAEVFNELLAEFSAKLPEESVVAQRLEKQKKFNVDRAKKIASVLEKSMQFAGVLDASNNILPIRGDKPRHQENGGPQNTPPPPDLQDQGEANLHKTEVPLADDRLVVVAYPHDLTTEEAQKVGKVLSALVG